jgi:formate hydrogenlyase subunit 3/multisubunit Na+/H+ antiporter MnhD subunit
MLGLTLASDLILLVAFFETTALCSWALIGFDRADAKARAAALTALRVTGTSSLAFLVGILILHSHYGTLQIDALIAVVRPDRATAAACSRSHSARCSWQASRCSRSRSRASASFLVLGLSLAGRPPSAGFIGKVALFGAGIDAASVVVLAVFMLGSGLTLLYFVQAWQRAWWEEPRVQGASPWVSRCVLALLGVVVRAAGLWPSPMVEWSLRAAAALVDMP